MKWLKLKLYLLFLPKLLKKSCPSIIPRSGEEGQKVNCYTIVIDKENKPYLILKCIKEKCVEAIMWNGQDKYDIDVTIQIAEILDDKLSIQHYFGLSTIEYFGIYDYLFHKYSRWIYIKTWLWDLNYRWGLFIYKKKKLVSKKRIDLLNYLVDHQLNSSHKGVKTFDLMTELYSIRWASHPDGDKQLELLELYLESLCESGELIKVNDEYVVTGKSLSTLEKDEELERRHQDSVRTQRRVFWLTLFLLLAALIQSGVIKIPVLLDFTN